MNPFNNTTMQKILLILALIIGISASAQVPSVTSQKFRPQDNPPTNPVKGQMYFNTNGTYYYYDTDWKPLGLESDNKLKLKSFRSSQNSLRNFAQSINEMPLFEVTGDELQLFYVSIFGDAKDTDIYCVAFKDVGKGSYGIGGTQITSDNLMIIGTLPVTGDTIDALSTTQHINLGNGGTLSIVEIFNNHTFTGDEVPIQNQSDGFVLIDVQMNAQDMQYLFVGDGGLYGVGGDKTATADNFILLTNIEASENTQFVELGEIGSSPIHTVFNSHNTCINIQPKENGYAIINTLINGTKVQYLFIGASGSYGDGCALIAYPDDFTSFIPVGEKEIIPKLFHVVGPSNSDSGVLATEYNQNMIHGGDIIGRSIYSNNGFFSNTGYTGTVIRGNTNVRIESSNPNNGEVRITSNGQVNVESSGSTKRTLRVGRLYSSGLATTGVNHLGIVIDDDVDLTNKTNSTYTAFYINPIIGNMNGNTWHSIISERGNIDFRNGLLKLSSYNSSMPISEVATAGLGLDNQGNVVKTVLGGGGSGTGAVDSVFGRTGDIVQMAGDYNVSQVTDAQPTLVSGINIKTINNQSIVGPGNISITGGSGANNYIIDVNLTGRDLNFVGVGSAFNGTVQLPTVFGRSGNITSQIGDYTVEQITGAQPLLVSGTNIRTINNQSLLGNGNISVPNDRITSVTTSNGKMHFTGFGSAFNGSVDLDPSREENIVGTLSRNLELSGDYDVRYDISSTAYLELSGDSNINIIEPEFDENETVSRMMYIKPNGFNITFPLSFTERCSGCENLDFNKEFWIVTRFFKGDRITTTQISNVTIFPSERQESLITITWNELVQLENKKAGQRFNITDSKPGYPSPMGNIILQSSTTFIWTDPDGFEITINIE